MEEDKKKRKAKKKKNKQSKTVGDGVTAVGEATSGDPNLVNHGKGDEQSQLLEIADVQSRNVVDSNGHGPSVKECVISEEMLRKLKEENDVHIQREAMSEETIRQLREQTELCFQKEACLEMRVAQLQSERDSLIQKEVGLEERVYQLLNEKSSLSQQVESLVERIKLLEGDLSSSINKENSAKETISSLNGNIRRLQVQLAELEESRNSLLLENQQLENISGLQSEIQNLEKSSSACLTVDASAKDNVSEHEDLKNQIEAARTLVEKLVEENAGLVEKVNELYAQLDQRSATVELSRASVPDGMTEYAEPAGVAILIPKSEEIASVSAQELDSLEDDPVQDKNDTIDAKDVAGVVSDSLVSDDGFGEIVQIPLDDNEVRDQLALEEAENLEEDVVPLADAPLIGAPFRLISFVAKYVSGADLVNKSSSDSIH